MGRTTTSVGRMPSDAELIAAEKKRAFEICGGKSPTLDKDQLYSYVCALGETPTAAQTAALSGGGDEAGADAKYEEIKAANAGIPYPYPEETVKGWFDTWAKDGKIPFSKLSGDVEEGLQPLSAEELEQLKKDIGSKLNGDEWEYDGYLQTIISGMKMKTGSATYS